MVFTSSAIEDVVITFNEVMNGILVILRVQDDMMWTALGALHLGNLKVRYGQSLYARLMFQIP
ncbi:hypothetical protein Patl1_19497 [Pistacia atlantica]|uniref:Uncharacterized protein n=1 Tax=Pistacia atlantica TaxID=434234 RepID=A0ACC1C086_9ROSI|nr:hypothetical protein Patl1_19497 [Pistacia atlantica]